MSESYVLILIAMALLAVFALFARRRTKPSPNLDQALTIIRSLDIEAFRNLVSPEEEDFLRASLPPAEFRKIKRERIRAALAYVRALSTASLQLARFADAAQHNADPALADSGRQIATSAVYLRLRALDASTRLAWAIAFPDLPSRPLRSLLDQYDHAIRLLLNHNGLTRAESRAS